MLFASRPPYTLLLQRSQQALDALDSQIQSGQIATQADLLAGVLAAVASLTATLAAPTLQPPVIRADDLLIRETVSTPVSQASDDVATAASQIEALRLLNEQIFNVCQAERQGLSDLLAECQALVDDYRVWVSDSDPSFVWASDTFNDASKIDPASTVFVDVHGGVVTLPPVSATSLSPFITALTLDKKQSAGGLPGNNMEIQAVGQPPNTGSSPEPRPILFADNQPQSNDITAILDGKPETWFEWERVYCIFPQPILTVGTAAVYDPSGKEDTTPLTAMNWNCYIQWPGEASVDTGGRQGYPLAYFTNADRQPLRLVIQITLDQPRPVSWLQLSPYLKGTAYPTVEQILISNDGSTWKGLLDTPTVLNPRINRGVDFSQLGAAASNFEGMGVWAFPAVPIRFVKIVLSQSQTYKMPLGLGHAYYLAQVFRKSKGVLPSIGIGAAGATVTRRVQGPLPTAGSANATPGAASPVPDFSPNATATQGSLDKLYDIFQAERQVIGIRDLLLEARTYGTAAQLVSVPFVLAKPIKEAALLTTEKIPASWSATAPDGKGWIAYEVSADGQTWQPIIPQSAGQLEGSTVVFSPTTTLSFRATFRAPDGNSTETAMLMSYALKCLPA